MEQRNNFSRLERGHRVEGYPFSVEEVEIKRAKIGLLTVGSEDALKRLDDIIGLANGVTERLVRDVLAGNLALLGSLSSSPDLKFSEGRHRLFSRSEIISTIETGEELLSSPLPTVELALGNGLETCAVQSNASYSVEDGIGSYVHNHPN